MNYSYPIDASWTKQEVIDMVRFFSLIETAYENRVERNSLLQAYRRLKEIVPGKSEEKQLFNAFEQESGYSSYHTIKKARNTEQQYISM
ncbi:UPF0223 family protein [Ornithinibacillus gellani]|uniref:UPF0223 family protein n=1 Tax=Ornithinibacillus gellani TaxID=2293253 RepID=UPI000F4AD27C|nr:UPF0223 family protein [Ornithinibacillus gellani]TQS75698.1 UPF0223 family protein [Ornithinibacillus gellani]